VFLFGCIATKAQVQIQSASPQRGKNLSSDRHSVKGLKNNGQPTRTWKFSFYALQSFSREIARRHQRFDPLHILSKNILRMFECSIASVRAFFSCAIAMLSCGLI
jgi:hypothetical protein